MKEIDINSPHGKRLNETLSNRLNLTAENCLIAPSIFIEDDYLSPEDITESKVEALIQKYERVRAGVRMNESKLVKSTPFLSPSPQEIKKAEESMIECFKSLGFLTILSAGLLTEP